MSGRVEIRELLAGLTVIGIGGFAALYSSWNYPVGVLARIGPGFFPQLLGWLLVVLGGVIVASSLRQAAIRVKPPPVFIRAFLAVLLSVAVFALTIERLGLVPAAILLTIVAAAARKGYRLKRVLILGACLAVLSWLIFSLALQMPLSAFVLPG